MYKVILALNLSVYFAALFGKFVEGLFSSSSRLDSVLREYDTLYVEDIVTHHVARRSTEKSLEDRYRGEKRVSFNAFGRSFQLRLYEDASLLSEDLQAIELYNNTATDITLDTVFYTGFIDGEPKHLKVFAYWENGELMATIRTRNETYYVEPSWRHLPESSNYTMIVYRLSDVKTDEESSQSQPSFCGLAVPSDSAAYSEAGDVDTESNETSGSRKKRQIDGGGPTTCPVMLVADYRFYKNVGGSDLKATTNYMIGVLTRVNNIYQSTQFGTVSNLGFEIKGILVNTSPTNVTAGQIHYNMLKTDWDSMALLNAFSSVPDWNQYCLAHLLTYTAFADSVLGLSWVASSQPNAAGGICSQCSSGKCYNTGWTSSQNKYERMLTTLEADLVMAHEFGHNWGSQHDPADTECAPSSANRGKFLMYQYSVTGTEANNNHFSPCSTRTIASVLAVKRSSCFSARSTSFCGNYNVEGSEQCDGGPTTRAGNDPCCSSGCQLRLTANCSDSNSLCCQQCQPAPNTTSCQSSNSGGSCTAQTNCSGFSSVCPLAPSVPDGTSCANSGICRGGTCRNICEYQGQLACICTDDASSCTWCCQRTISDTCLPYRNSSTASLIYLADGEPCWQGYCEKGQCAQVINTATARLWNFISNLSVNAVLQFVRNNVVLVTIFISIILYLPLCIFIACKDCQRVKKHQDKAQWFHASNKTLIRDENYQTIQKVPGFKRRRPQDMSNPMRN